MPAVQSHAGRIRLLAIAGCLCIFAVSCAVAASHRSKPQSPFARAQRLRESLERRPERLRTRRDYERSMDAYRAIYHSDPASPHAPASVFAVADLLAEEGRVLNDDKPLHDAIGQYEFLRTNYPHSSYRQSALLAEAEIYLRDLNDAPGARSMFEKYLRLYPKSQFASEARIELRDLRHSPHPASKRPELAHDEAPELSPVFTPIPHHARPGPKHEHPAATTVAKAPVHPEPSKAIEEVEDSAPAVSRSGTVPLVTGIRYWSTPIYTRIAIDLQNEVRYEAIRVSNPDRIFFDLYGARLSPKLVGQSDHVIDDGFLHRIHAEQFSSNVTRVVLNVSDVSQYYAFFLPNPSRLVIDIRAGRVPPKQEIAVAAPKSKPMRSQHSVPQNLALIHAIGLGPATIPDDEIGGPLPLVSHPAAIRVRATRRPTTAPVEQTFGASIESRAEVAAARRPGAVNPNQPKATQFYAAPQPNANGQLSMVRALGLKINRIVIDAGHGGHDSGTLGPDGMEEKNVVLDVALRLGALLRQRLGADVIYTRDTDTFIPLETRTAIANKAQADLFISIHANSSPDPSARGVETYYLSFTTSEDALEVAARENAVSSQSIHQLSDLVKKIALQDKLEESREFADDVQQSIYQGLETGNPGLKDRGVKKAPFVVLIGANMPSILTEISFLTNPEDASELRQPQYRQRIAEALYRGVARYVGSLNGVRVADAASVAPAAKSE